jgi:hypothetical protein
VRLNAGTVEQVRSELPPALVVGRGADETLVVADGAMMVAVAGLIRPKVVGSSGALLGLGDGELAASGDH